MKKSISISLCTIIPLTITYLLDFKWLENYQRITTSYDVLMTGWRYTLMLALVGMYPWIARRFGFNARYYHVLLACALYEVLIARNVLALVLDYALGG